VKSKSNAHFLSQIPLTVAGMTGKRAKTRIDTTAEIIRLARQQIATKGAPNLSLREIAREMGMASSAIYRYFASRDQLLTAIIIETYDQLGSVIESADAECARNNLIGRWNAIASALRTWAIANGSDYGLVFGTPVPGYEAPNDTNIPASRYTNVLLRLLADAHAAGCRSSIEIPDTKGIVREYKHLKSVIGLDAPDGFLLAGLAGWAAMLGALNLELFGHVDTVFDNPGIHFSALADMFGRQMLGFS
jgi:AcrR family transcriptional regulator